MLSPVVQMMSHRLSVSHCFWLFFCAKHNKWPEHQHFFMKKGMQTEEMYEQLIAASSDTESPGRIQMSSGEKDPEWLLENQRVNGSRCKRKQVYFATNIRAYSRFQDFPGCEQRWCHLGTLNKLVCEVRRGIWSCFAITDTVRRLEARTYSGESLNLRPHTLPLI